MEGDDSSQPDIHQEQSEKISELQEDIEDLEKVSNNCNVHIYPSLHTY